MYNQTKYFIFATPDDGSKNYYQIDNAGNIIETSIFDGPLKPFDVNPGGISDMKISFIRNIELDGVNRIFADPLRFISESLQIIKTKFYSSTGMSIETRIRILIFEYNAQPQPGDPTLQKLIDMPLDMFKYSNNSAGKGFTAAPLEGGFMQAYTAYGNNEFIIPCDGSIPQNCRIYFDGMQLPDVFNYNILAFNPHNPYLGVVPVGYVGNEGDNFNIIHSDLSTGNVSDLARTNPYGFFSSTAKIRVRLKGNIILKNSTGANRAMALITYSQNTDGGLDVLPDNSNILVGQTGTDPDTDAHHIGVISQAIYHYDKFIDIDPNQPLFFRYSGGGPISSSSFTGAPEIIGGTFQIIFSSVATPTTCWGITLADAMEYMVNQLSIVSKAAGFNRTYNFDKTYLNTFKNLILTSGAAIQMSGNPDQGKYYQIYDGITPNNLVTAFGPVIKISFADLFTICKIYCFGGLTISSDNVAFVSKNNLWDSSNSAPYDIGEVADADDSVAEDYHFTGVKIGAKTIAFDQKAGNYDFNTSATYVSTMLSSPLKYLDLVAPVCTSPFAFEHWRSGQFQAPTSITNNDNDNTTCLVNVDTSAGKQVPDTETISFTSELTDFNSSSNTNIKLITNESMQPLAADSVNGSYLSLLDGPDVFVFSEPTLNATKVLKLSYDGFLTGLTANSFTGLPADWVRIGLFINGVEVDFKLFTIGDAGTIGPKLPLSHNFTVTRNFGEGNVIFLKMSTSLNAGGQLDNCEIDIFNADGVTNYWTVTGQLVPIHSGTPAVLVSLPYSTAPTVPYLGKNVPVLTTQFQYYFFNSILARSEFSYRFRAEQTVVSVPAQAMSYYFFKNGILIDQVSVHGIDGTGRGSTGVQSHTAIEFDFPSETLSYGDIFFVLASASDINAQITKFETDFTATGLTCSPPYRVEYDILSGIPNLAINPATGKISTAVAGAPYNIEGITWARLFDMWKSWIAGPTFDQPRAVWQFSKADKNPFLYTSRNGVTFKENNSIRRADMGVPLITNRKIEFTTEVAINFSTMYKNIVNKLIKFSIYGEPFFGFALSLDQQPTLNAAQKWSLLFSPITDQSQFINLNFDDIKYLQMSDRSIRINYSAPVMFVAKNRELPAGCHFFSVDQGLISENLHRWFEKFEWRQPWQIGDSINLQNWVKGLTPTIVEFHRLDDDAILRSVEYTATVTNGAPLDTSIMNMQVSLDTAGLPECEFYLVVKAAGDSGSVIVSEPMELLADQPDTILLKYGSTYNAQGVPFTTGYEAYIRVRGNILNTAVIDLKAEFFTDDNQDVTLLGAAPFEGFIFDIDLMPDRMVKTLNRILALNKLEMEAIGPVTRAAVSGKLEKVFDEEGLALRSYRIQMKETINRDGYDVVAGEFVEDSILTASIDVGTWGNNGDNETPGDDSQVTDFEIIV